jgi:hypothetical protein
MRIKIVFGFCNADPPAYGLPPPLPTFPAPPSARATVGTAKVLINIRAVATTSNSFFTVIFSLSRKLNRDSFISRTLRKYDFSTFVCSEFVTEMTLKSALQDLRETTLAAISGLLAKLSYLASLRDREGGYRHWGLSLVHGEESSERALKAAHTEVLSTVLRTPISQLEEDVQESSGDSDASAESYVEGMRKQVTGLLPSAQDAASARHLNSVLVALSSLEKNRKRATRSTS